AFVRALVILDERHVDQRAAVAERLQAEFLAIETLLDHYGFFAALEQLGAVGDGVIDRLQMSARDFHAFSAGQPVWLDDELSERLKPVSNFRREALEDAVVWISRDSVLGQQRSRERLARLQPRQRHRRPHGRNAFGTKRIDDAGS